MSLATTSAILHRLATRGLREEIKTIRTEIECDGTAEFYHGRGDEEKALRKNYGRTFMLLDDEFVFDCDGETYENPATYLRNARDRLATSPPILMPIDDSDSDEEDDEIVPLSPVLPTENDFVCEETGLPVRRYDWCGKTYYVSWE